MTTIQTSSDYRNGVSAFIAPTGSSTLDAWHNLLFIEPALASVEHLARSGGDDRQWEAVKARLKCFCGWDARRDELRSRAAWDFAYDHCRAVFETANRRRRGGRR